MKKMDKCFVTRIHYTASGWNWGIWDKVKCEWINFYFGREDALMVADSLNYKKA